MARSLLEKLINIVNVSNYIINFTQLWLIDYRFEN
jgi:hypothetical protein